MEVREWLLTEIQKLKINHIFLVPGMEIDPLCSVMNEYSSITPIVACHEEGAGFMADGYSRVKNKMSVCLAIGAPGAANLIPAILNARADYSKVLFLTGGSPIGESGRNTFQNSAKSGTNDAELISSAALYSNICYLPSLIPMVWRDAVTAVHSDLSGPAHITVPQDLQTQDMEPADFDHDYTFSLTHSSLVDTNQLDELVNRYLMKKSKILILIGRGAKISNAGPSIEKFIEKYQLPFSTTMGGKGIISETHPLYAGMLGYPGLGKVSYACHKRAMELLVSPELEAIITVGVSLSFFAALHRDKGIKPACDIIQIDSNRQNLGKSFPAQLKIQSNASAAFNYLNHLDIPKLLSSVESRKHWMQTLTKIPLFYQEDRVCNQSAPIDPAYVVHSLNKAMPDDTILFIDTGIHSTIAGHFWLTRKGGDIVYASNLGPMGFSIPAAIGGKLAAPNQTVVAITGDGCMRMHGIEIMTAVHYKIPVIIVVSNNSALGKVYVRAKNTNEEAKDLTLLPQANWADFAKSLGADGIRVSDPKDLPAAYKMALASKGPYVIDVITNRDVPTIL